jgi:hypothetical protein
LKNPAPSQIPCGQTPGCGSMAKLIEWEPSGAPTDTGWRYPAPKASKLDCK